MSRIFLALLLLTSPLFLASCQAQTTAQHKAGGQEATADANPPGGRRLVRSDAEWKKILTSEQYYVTREEGTERPWSSPFNKNKQKGVYYCVSCKNPLFSSKAKFESGTGWPSFFKPIAPNAVREKTDRSLGMERSEILCSVCDAHLGHVFDDGPNPTGLRYCMNGVALGFDKK